MYLTTIIRVPSSVMMNIGIKNYVCHIGLAPIRQNLQKLFTDLVQPHLGSMLAPLVGDQLGLAYALPVTLFYADMVALAVHELIHSIYTIFASVFFGIPVSKPKPIVKECILKVSSYGASYFTKTYFCNYGMPFMSKALQGTLTTLGPALGVPGVVVSSATVFIPLYVAPVTITVGNCLGSLASELVYHSGQKLLSKKDLQVIRW